jgi:cytochrome c oxidase subunit IV
VADHNKHQDAAGHSGGEHAHGSGRYFVIWALLLVATLTTVITGRMDLGAANLPLALVIASIKATLVVLFFMHLWDSEGINRLVFGVSVVFVIVLLLGVFGDLLTRQAAALPTGAGAPGLHIEHNPNGIRPAHAPAHAE